MAFYTIPTHSISSSLLLLLLPLLLFSFHPSYSSSSIPSSSSSSSLSIHDLLRSKGLPAGLLPREVQSYKLDSNGHLEVYLEKPCLTKFEDRVYFETVVSANLSYGGLIGVVGLSQEELFIWLPVKDIIVDDPSSGLILFDIGYAHKQFSVSLFEDPPSCRSQGFMNYEKDMGKGFQVQR